MAATGEQQCPYEDHRGQRCSFGIDHESRCRYGAARLTDGQREWMARLLTGSQETFGRPSRLLALRKHALVACRFIGMRWWAWALTSRGRQIALELPR